MPIYEYRCDGCGPFSLWREATHSSTGMICPDCLSEARRRYTGVAIVSATGGSANAGAIERARINRARTGEPHVTGALSGSSLPRSRRHAH